MLVFGLGMDFGFIFLAFVGSMENYFNSIGLILVSMEFSSVVGHIFFVVDLSSGEVCLEVWPGLVDDRFVITVFDCVGKYVCFCGDYFSNAD